MPLREIQEVHEEIHARPGLLPRQAVDASEEGQRVADGELVVERQLLLDAKTNPEGRKVLLNEL